MPQHKRLTPGGPWVELRTTAADWKSADVVRKFGPTVIAAARAVSGASEFRPMALA